MLRLLSFAVLRSRLALALGVLGLLGALAAIALRDDEPRPGQDARRPVPALAPLEPAIAALGRETWRVRAPGAIERLAARRGARPGALAPDDGVDEKVRAAISRIAKAADADPVVARALGETIERAGGIEILADDDPHGALVYDLWGDEIRVPRCVADFPEDLLATAVSHELCHAADHREVAAALGLSTETLALLLDDLAGTTRGRLHVLELEDRALTIELRVAEALGVTISASVPQARPEPGCPIHPSDLSRMLATLRAARGDPEAWRAQLDRMFP